MLENKDAIIFDMDGTLVNSMWVWVSLDKEYMKRHQLTVPDKFHEKMEGMSYTETAEYFVNTFPELGRTVEQVKEDWLEMIYELYMKEVPLKDGVIEFIKQARSDGKKIGIATSNTRTLVEATLQSLDIASYFDAICTSCEVAAGKPSPDVYLEAATRLQVEPKRCLVFEDVPNGILAGKNAGMTVCGVEDEYSKHYVEKKKALADYYIRDYYEVLNHTYEVLL